MKNFLKTDIFIYIILFGVCIFILLQSPLAPYAKSANGVDSSVFIYSAQQILDGKIMYKDIVDHKGPFLYFINELALFIFNGKYIGIWIFEILSLFATSVIMYKTARFFADRLSSFFAVITSILFLVPLLIGGNFTEEWALPYISIAMYIFVSYLKKNKPLNIVRLFILSFTFVLTFMLRANLVAIWGGFGVALLIKWIIEKNYKELTRNLLLIFMFVLLSLLPFFLYLYFQGALNDAIYLVFKYNMLEYHPKTKVAILRTGLDILLGKEVVFGEGAPLSIIPLIIAIYIFLRDKTIVNGGILFAFAFTTLACSLGFTFRYYFMIFSPILVIPYVYIYKVIKESIPKAKYISLLILFVYYNFPPIRMQAWTIHQNYSEQGYGEFTISPPIMKELKEIIIKNTKSTDKILVKGNQATLYLYSGRICATRFPYALQRSSLSEKYYVREAEDALPKMIIQGKIANSSWDTFNLDTLLNSRYQLLATDIKNVEIWKLKE